MFTEFLGNLLGITGITKKEALFLNDTPLTLKGNKIYAFIKL